MVESSSLSLQCLISATALMESREIANSMVVNNVGVTVGYIGACVVFGLSGLTSDQSIRKGEVHTLITKLA
ncbi:unnamed protein product [Arabis nemorensis]|uniref:Uncharacterized protein n=1 Tax=Arabis nemorensis TaxID=586526 RepID=A0A565CQH8_9BRAS|nr:unnamed protein product [Arabis nemorensis]